MAKSMNLQKKRLFVVLCVVILFFLIILSKGIYSVIYDDIKVSTDIVPEYQNLFTKDAQNKLALTVTARSRNRQATSAYMYDKKFYLFVFRVGFWSNSNLKKVISYRNESSNLFTTEDAWYSASHGSNYRMNVSQEKSSLVKSVIFRCAGDSIKSISQTDSLYCYYFKYNSFSIQYNDQPYDIVFLSNFRHIPGSVLFKKKGQFLYVVLMTVQRGDWQMRPDLLYSLIK